MSNAITLAKIIGTPLHTSYRPEENSCDTPDLITSATVNKIPLYYMNSIRKSSYFSKNEALLEKLNELESRHQSMKKVFEKIGLYSSKYSMDWSIFKTIKPYPYVGSDIDILLFDNNWDRAVSILKEMGGQIEGTGPHSVTLYYPEHDFLVDLYREISVTYMVYINKNTLKRFVTSMTLNDQDVPVLLPLADLLVNIGHSFYKEQFYALSDFYNATSIIAKLDSKGIHDLVDLIRSHCLEYAAREFFGLTQMIHSIAFGRSTKLDELNGLINSVSDEAKADESIPSIDLPYKYSPLALMTGFIDKISRDKLARSTALLVLRNMITNGKFRRHFVGQVLLHVRRRSY